MAYSEDLEQYIRDDGLSGPAWQAFLLLDDDFEAAERQLVIEEGYNQLDLDAPF